MSKIITPTVGRKVWYHHHHAIALPLAVTQHGTPENVGYPKALDTNQPMDATVVYVWSDRMVNLRVTDHIGRDFIATSVTLVQPGDSVATGSPYAEWVPYQVGQVEKQAGLVMNPPREGMTSFAGSNLSAQAAVAVSDFLSSDAPLVGACDLSGDGTCEACQ